MARSVKSSATGRSSRSRGSSIVSVKSLEVPLPKKTLWMDSILYFAGARPSNIMHLRRQETIYEDDEDWAQSSRSSDSSYSRQRKTTQFYFVATPDEYNVYDDNESVFSRQSSRSRSKSSSGSSGKHKSHRKSPRPADPWDKRQAHVEEEEYSDSDDGSDGTSSYASGDDYWPPPQQQQPMPGHPAMFQGPPPHGPSPPPPDNGPPAFFQIR